MKLRSTVVLFALALLGLLLLSACSKKEEQASNKTEEKAAAPATPIDQATVGSVSGVVKYAGTAPKPRKIDMSQDPACKGDNTTENLVVNNGNLENAFVYVKDGNLWLQSGASARQLTTGGRDAMPTWAADGQWIYFHSDRSGSRQIWKIPAAGGNAIQVTRGGGIEGVGDVGREDVLLRGRLRRRGPPSHFARHPRRDPNGDGIAPAPRLDPPAAREHPGAGTAERVDL